MLKFPAMSDTYTCSACGRRAQENFCANCGEPRLHQGENVGHLVHDLVHVLTHADTSIFRTLRDLFRMPGELTRAYFEGPRRRYLRPVNFFVVCNVLMFLLTAAEHIVPFSAPFDIQTQRQFYSPYIQPRAQQFLAHARDDYEVRELKRDYDVHTAHLSKSIVILLAIGFAVLLTLAFAGTKKFFVEHLVFALHFYSFFMLMTCLVGALLVFLSFLARNSGLAISTEVVGVGLLGFGSAAWLYFALRRFYHTGIASSIVRAIVLGTATIPLMILYRWFLFYATIWTL